MKCNNFKLRKDKNWIKKLIYFEGIEGVKGEEGRGDGKILRCNEF